MPCHAMPCRAVPCHAMPCYVMICYVMLCYSMLCYVGMYECVYAHIYIYIYIYIYTAAGRSQRDSRVSGFQKKGRPFCSGSLCCRMPVNNLRFKNPQASRSCAFETCTYFPFQAIIGGGGFAPKEGTGHKCIICIISILSVL